MAEIFEFKKFKKEKKSLTEETSAVGNDFVNKNEMKILRNNFHIKRGFDKIDKIMTSINERNLSASNLMEKRKLVRGYTTKYLLEWITDHEEIEWGGKEAFYKAVADEILDRFSILST